MFDIELEDDVVFARFLNYMQIALLHKKLDYEKHLEVIKKREEKINYVEWSKIQDKNDNNPFENLKRDYEKLKRAIDKLTPKLGIKNCRFYDLRGSYATRILKNGVEIRDVADILGHKNIETTENYYISSSDESRKEANDIFEKVIHSDIIDKISNYKY